MNTVLIDCQGAATYEDAHRIASRISTSALVKTALYGEDAKYVATQNAMLKHLLILTT